MRATLVLLAALVALPVVAVEKRDIPNPVPVPAPQKPDVLPVGTSALGQVVTFPALYTANKQNWVSVFVRIGGKFRAVNAKAMEMPILMHVRPGDILSLVVQKNDDQDWVIGLAFVKPNGSHMDEEKAESDSIILIDRTTDRYTTFVHTRRGHIYLVDRRLSKFEYFDGYKTVATDWAERLLKGQVVTFSYIERLTDGKVVRWATSAVVHRMARPLHLRNPHCDQQIVTKIVRTRFGPGNVRSNPNWWYVWTQFPKIRYEVDSRWNQDLRLQRIGDPPMWHKDREPSPYGEIAVIGRPVRDLPVVASTGTTISVNVAGSSVSNSVQSDNRVTGINSNSNRNQNTSSNTNVNDNTNVNENTNANNNNNQNTNNNSNNNSNSNQNDNQNNNSNNNANNNSLNNQNNVHNSVNTNVRSR